jgi:hypothetical protein
MKKYFLIIVFLGSSLLFSCEKIADNVDIPDIEPKLVATSFIKAGSDTVRLKLTKSLPIYYATSSNVVDVENAVVKISDGSQEELLTYSGPIGMSDGDYSTVLQNITISEGNAYNLSITTPEGESVKASCVVPSLGSYSLSLVDVDSNTSGDFWQTEYYYQFNLQDNGVEPNSYYNIVVIGYYKASNGGFFGDYMYTENSPYVKVQQGESINLTFNLRRTIKIEKIEAYVLKTDEHYYNYHQSVYNYDGDNPFAEPVIIYSNIDNGLGVFCSYAKQVHVFPVP